jgi:hypothetical protein
MGNLIYIFGVIAMLAGIGLFLFAFRILKPMIKSEEGQTRYDEWVKKYGNTSKILSIALVFFGAVNVIHSGPAQQKQPAMKTSAEWTAEDKAKLTNECFRMYMSQQEVPGTDADIAKTYCECTTEKMTSEFTLTDLLSHDSLNQTQKIQLYEPVVETCIKDLEFSLNERYHSRL